MNKTFLLGATTLRSAGGLGLLLAMSTAVHAQTTTAPPATAQDPAAVESQAAAADMAATSPTVSPNEIIVTGSRIRRPNLESVIPITSIRGEQFFQRGQNNIGDALNDLPQLRSSFAQQNPGGGVGIAGLSLLDLRGLGTLRTLVLVNGRRHVPADILSNAVSPDVNTIPNDLIERVDIVTGGNSAVYGSDAIAGVVNFVLRRSFDGIQIRGNAAVTGAGFGGNQYISAMAGKNFGGGRGNITLHGEFANQDRVFGSDIPALARVDGFGVIDVDPSGLTSGSDGFPDRSFIRDFRSTTINRFGLVPITQSFATNQCGVGLGQTNGPGSSTPTPGLAASATGLPYNCTYIFGADGRLTPQTGTRFGSGINSSIIGGNGQTGREGRLLSILPSLQRYNFNMLGHYKISDAFEPFVEAKWSRINAIGSAAGPSFIQSQLVQFDVRERPRLDNPFLNPADRTTIANAILASGCNPTISSTACNVPGVSSSLSRSSSGGQGTAGPLNATDIARINDGTYRFALGRQFLDSGIRDEQFTRDTYRVVAGLRGTFNTDWNYELSANYGKFKEDTTTFGYFDRQRFLLSLDAGRNPVTGQIQCRAQFDPASANAFIPGSMSAAQADVTRARLASDIAACVPYNPFGGLDNSAAANYFVYNALNKASLTQFDVLGFVNGDTSQIFSLPGGPISFVLGGEYRREKANYVNDPFIVGNNTNAVNVGLFQPKPFKVTEGFGELRIPLLKDMPLFHELSASAAGRVSDYGGSIGKVYTYNYGGEWSPIRDIRFRANKGKAVRAPNVSETGFPVVPNFAPGFQDPCSPSQIGQNPNRQGNCTTDLGASLLGGLTSRVYSLPILSGSNPDLQPETSNSLTIGGVLQPRFIPGFSLSVDYYNIKVKNVIVSLSAQSIVNNCYDQSSLANPFCALFTRFRGPGSGPLGEAPGDLLGNSLISAGVNFAKRVRRGIDVNANYRANLGRNVKLDTSVIYVHGIQNSNFERPDLPNFENRILSELGDPKDEARFDADLTVGRVTFGYRARYIGPMYVNAFEDFNALPSACIGTSCPPNNLDFADIRKFPAVSYHDLRLEFDLQGASAKRGMKFYLGVDNVLNQQPPLGSTATGAGSAIYDIRGRNFYAGFRARL